MKKTIVAVMFIVLPALGFAAGQITPFKNSYDFQAQIDNARGPIYLYETKLLGSTTTCVVATQNFGSSGANIDIDCK